MSNIETTQTKKTSAEQALTAVELGIDESLQSLLRFVLGIARYNAYDAGYRAGLEYAQTNRPVHRDIRLHPNYGPEDVALFAERSGITLSQKE